MDEVHCGYGYLGNRDEDDSEPTEKEGQGMDEAHCGHAEYKPHVRLRSFLQQSEQTSL